MENRLKPEIIVFAGPNGSGKSTITDLLRRPDFDYVNADDIKRNLKCDDLEAAKIATDQREQMVDNMKNFCFETVLSKDRNLKLLQKAKEKGYFIRCYYVLTINPEINVSRVHSRVMNGGHDVPVEKIYSRYYDSLNLLKEVIKVVDIVNVIDNSIKPYRIFKKRKTEYFYDEHLSWNINEIKKLTGCLDLIKKLLNEN